MASRARTGGSLVGVPDKVSDQNGKSVSTDLGPMRSKVDSMKSSLNPDLVPDILIVGSMTVDSALIMAESDRIPADHVSDTAYERDQSIARLAGRPVDDHLGPDSQSANACPE